MRLSISWLVMLLAIAICSAQNQSDEPGAIHGLVLIEGTQPVKMKDTVASRDARWGVAVSKQYFRFAGAKAALRTKTLPEFQFDAEPDSDEPVYLFRFDRRSDRREIRVAKGSGGLAVFELPKDHIVPTKLDEIGNAQGSIKRYRLKTTAPLAPGEYCISRSLSVCYDFGVD